MKNSALVISGSKETAKKGTDGQIVIDFSSKSDLREKASKIVGIKWRFAGSFENGEFIKQQHRICDDSFDSVEDVVDFVYR